MWSDSDLIVTLSMTTKNRGFEIIALISKSIIVLRQVKSETNSKSTLSLAVVAISAYYKYVIFVKWLSVLQRLSQSNSGFGTRSFAAGLSMQKYDLAGL